MAKYDTLRKLRRNVLLLEYRRQNPDSTLKEIGKIFNISEQRVWIILKRLLEEGKKVEVKKNGTE